MNKEEGLVLRSFDFRDRQKIITLFTRECGLLSLIVKGITRKKPDLVALTSPFTRGEFHFTIRKSDLYSFKDGSILDTHNRLRRSYAHIEAASLMVKGLLTTQMPGKPAPLLYQLTLSYLKLIADCEEPSALSSSFLLKLLKHEGNLWIAESCTLCDQRSSHLFEGEPFCTSHAPAFAQQFSQEEWIHLHALTESRKKEELLGIRISEQLQEKIYQLFMRKEGLEPSRGNLTTPSR